MSAGAQIAGLALLFLLIGFVLAWSLCRIAAWSDRDIETTVTTTRVGDREQQISRETLRRAGMSHDAGLTTIQSIADLRAESFIDPPFALQFEWKHLPFEDQRATLYRDGLPIGSASRLASGLWHVEAPERLARGTTTLSGFPTPLDAVHALWAMRLGSPTPLELDEAASFFDGPFRLEIDTARVDWPDAPAILMRDSLCLGSVVRSEYSLWRAGIMRGQPPREICLGRFDRRLDAMNALWEARHHEPCRQGQ